MTVSRTTFVFEVLHRTDEPLDNLYDALREAETSHAVGQVVEQHSVDLDDDDVADELRDLGNDGEFFDDDLNPDANPSAS